MKPCPICGKADTSGQTGKRARRCKSCVSHIAVQNRRNNPQNLIRHRFYNSCRQGWLKMAPSSLWSPATVQYVCQRWESRSVISGATDMAQLRIITFYGKDHGFPNSHELVLVTEREAQKLCKMTGAARAAQFPPQIAQRIAQAGQADQGNQVHEEEEEEEEDVQSSQE